MFLEAPLLIVGVGLLIGGLNYLEKDVVTGISLIVLSIAVILVEKYVEKKDSKK